MVVLLQAQSMEDSAKGIHIAEVLKTALREWGLGTEGQVNRGFMVTDAGHNVINAVERAGFQGIVCTAHKLHLVVGDDIGLGVPKDSWCEGTLDTKALLDKGRKIIGENVATEPCLEEIKHSCPHKEWWTDLQGFLEGLHWLLNLILGDSACQQLLGILQLVMIPQEVEGNCIGNWGRK
ncbi:hypothetical protein JRQ81_014665 [Phrynocephalus forsythii]|uniref:Uncharacterized protein n=1 Tax=Phrynocephalus forsythii TaxID=171643 RepID=A0A9Q0XZ55_9SAUR|nr:hypothetical protein JRQ81_014665 [Phrynocephalus forsythii]